MLILGAMNNICHSVFSVAFCFSVGVEENVTVTGAAQTHTLTELEGGRTYRVRMASRTAAGYSHASSKSIYQLTTSPGAGKSCFVSLQTGDTTPTFATP